MASTDWIQKLQSISGDSLGGKLERIVLIPVVAFFLQVANALEAILDVFIVPTNMLIDGIGAFISTLFGTRGTGMIQIISAGAQETIESIATFSILGFPVGIALAMSAGLVVAGYLSLDITSDFIPFSFSDFPFIGVDEDEE